MMLSAAQGGVSPERRSEGRLFHRIPWLIGALAFLSLLQGCAAPERLAAVPEDQEGAVETVSGMTNIRYWEDQDADVERLWQDRVVAHKREMELLAAAEHKGPLPPAYFLAISGGAEDGAFGAGLLNGWTEAGTRPEFTLVTGVSTGALTAPFHLPGVNL